jgi:ribosomal protein S18 acetylase RimI-like enzyme
MIIRKATPNDALSVAICLLSAMEEIVYQFIGNSDSEKAGSFMLHFVQQPNNQYSWQNCWVVEMENEVIAAASIYDGSKLEELRQPVIEYIGNKYQHHFMPEDETAAGEYYIDSIGVLASQRGKGIGSKLLQFLIDEYVNRQNKTLGLLVEEANPLAKRLYLKMGFQPVARRIVFGKNMEHLQIQPTL